MRWLPCMALVLSTSTARAECTLKAVATSTQDFDSRPHAVARCRELTQATQSGPAACKVERRGSGRYRVTFRKDFAIGCEMVAQDERIFHVLPISDESSTSTSYSTLDPILEQ